LIDRLIAAVPFVVKAATFRVLIAIFGEQRLIRQNIPVLVKLGMGGADVQAIVDAGMSPGMFEKLINALRGVDFRKVLAGIEQPVLIVNGSRDKPMISQKASFVAVGRQVTCHRIGDSEHGVSMLRSTEFAALVNDFAERTMATDLQLSRSGERLPAVAMGSVEMRHHAGEITSDASALPSDKTVAEHNASRQSRGR